MSKLYTTLKDISNDYGFDFTQEQLITENEYPILISKHYLNLIDKADYQNDPIWKQCIPDEKELYDTPINAVSEDPLSEELQMPVPRLIHRYRDRAVLLSSNRCTTHCRFCFRKRYWKYDVAEKDISTEELDSIRQYLNHTPEIKEILVSGGDPLILSTNKLKEILDTLYSVGSIEIVRIATRVPVTLPELISKDKIEILASFQGLWLITHFNHPNELNNISMNKCKEIILSGIPILNQTVLLKDINDSAIILEDLFRTLVKNRIKPYYLFHVDPVKGVTHFTTGIKKGLDIIKYFRENLSTLATPFFAIDLPEGGGKVSLMPNYKYNDKYQSIDNKRYIKYYTE